MITEEQAENIKNIIGTNYSKKIESFLMKKAIRNTNGFPYTAHYIRNVVNGSVYNEALEESIIDAVAFYKRKAKRQERIKAKILKTA